ncbi:MAG: PEP-utilizing enzyme [Dehalococcoidia bacterium]
MTPAPAAPAPVASGAVPTPPPGYWQREASHFPQPLTPAFRVFLDWENDIWLKLAAEHGMMFDGIEFREIGGWVYQRLRPLGGKDRKAPPAPIMWVLVRTVPQLRGRIKTLLAAQKADLTMQQLDHWHGTWKAEQIETIARLRIVDLDALSDAALDAHADDVSAFGYESMRRHFELTLALGTIAELFFFCEEKLGWTDRQVVELLSGLSVASTEPSRRLAELARLAAERPAVRQLIESGGADAYSRLVALDAEFAAAFDAYQHEFGCRALRYEVVDPTLEEVPALTLGLIRDQINRNYDPEVEATALRRRRDATVDRARKGLFARPPADRDEFERLLARAERYYPTREDNELYTVSAPLALLRYTVVEYGRRLHQAGLIDSPEDVFFLEWPELSPALQEGRDSRALVAGRKAERASVIESPGAASYGVDPGGPPPLGVFPKEAANNIRMVLWATEKVFGAEAQRENESAAAAQPSAGLRGVPAAPGAYTGPVRVILDETEFDRIQPGDVLVCPITSPVWSILFPSVGALVTDTGGILSHPAIISREYGIPAVVATGTATSTLKDGQIVTVDGATGLVTPAA